VCRNAIGTGEHHSPSRDWLANRITSASDNIYIFVAEAEGRVVSAAWLVSMPGTEFNALWGGSTLAAWRRRGIYRALMQEITLGFPKHSGSLWPLDLGLVMGPSSRAVS
jgi:hypothetical protein